MERAVRVDDGERTCGWSPKVSLGRLGSLTLIYEPQTNVLFVRLPRRWTRLGLIPDFVDIRALGHLWKGWDANSFIIRPLEPL